MRVVLILCILALLFLHPAFSADKAGAPARGKFLVATKILNDPRFHEKVLLIVQHEESAGSLGLILNYPTKVSISEAFPKNKMERRKSQPLYVGGPVDIKQVFTLFRLRGSTEDRELPEIQKIFGDVYVASGVETAEALVENLKPYEDLRIYVGYAGWAPGQLEFEMKTGHWNVWEPDAAMIFSSHPSEVWPEMLRRSSVIEALAMPNLRMIGHNKKVR